MRPIVTLLSDFGAADGYVAEMKGVILTLAPEAQLVDIAHDVAAQDVEAGRLALARYWRRFPPGTVHLAIVDPTVGSPRAALAVASDGRYLVGPDNGLLSPALLVPGARAIALATPPAASATFHGRDVFAPAAAMLAAGRPLESLGAAFESPIIRRTPEPHRMEDGGIRGEVISIDRFGNAVTNLLGIRVSPETVVEVAGRRLPLRRTYADSPPGAMAAIVGSNGLIELAMRDGDAARSLGIGRGAMVVLRSG